MHEKVVRLLLEGRENVSKAYASAANSVRKFSHDVDDNNKAMARSEAQTTALRTILRGLTNESNQARASIRGLSSELRGIGFVAAIALAQDLATALNALGGSLISVASAAGFAAGAIGGLAAAGFAQAVPAIAVLIGAMKQIGSVFQLVQKESDRTVTAGKERESQLNSEHEAALRVADAARQLAEAQRGLTEARYDAKRELRDLVLAEREAGLAAKRSSLSLSEARENLQGLVKRGGSAREIQDAQLSVAEAEAGRSSSLVSNRRSEIDLRKARRKGVDGSERVIQATNALRNATLALSAAQKSQAQASEKQGSSAAQLADELAKLTPAEKRLFDIAKRFKGSAEKALQPISDIFVNSFGTGIQRVEKLMLSGRGKKLLGSFKGLASAQADGIQQILDHMLSPGVVKRLEQFTDAAATNIKPITTGLLRLFDAFGNVAHAALPVFSQAAGVFSQWAKGLKESSSNTQGLEEFFEKGFRTFRLWAKLGGEILDLFGALGSASYESGNKTLESFTATIERATSYIKDNRKDVKGFFEDAREGTAAIGEVLVALGRAIVKLNDPQKLQVLSTFLISTLIPALEIAVRMMGLMTTVALGFINLPFVGEITKWVLALVIFRGAMLKLLELVKVHAFVAFFAGIGKEIRDLYVLMRTFGAMNGFRKYLELIGLAGGKMKIAMAGAAFAIAALIVHFGIAQAALKKLGDAINGVINFFQDLLGVSKTVAIALIGIGVVGMIAVFLQFASAVGKVVLAFHALKAAALSNPFTALAVVLGTVAGALGLFNTEQDETIEKAKKARDALREQTSALRELEDISRGIEESETSVQRSRLQQLNAEKELTRAKKGGNKREIQEAKLAVKEARLSRERAESELRRAREDAPRKRQDARVAAAENFKAIKADKEKIEDAIRSFKDKIGNTRGKISESKDLVAENVIDKVPDSLYEELKDATKGLAKEKEHLADVENKLASAQRNTARASDKLKRGAEDARDPVKKLGDAVQGTVRPTKRSADSMEEAHGKVRKLTKGLPDVGPASEKARKAMRNTGKSASNLGSVVGGVASAVADFVNKGLSSLGAKPLNWNGKIDSGSIIDGAKSVGSAVGNFLGFAGGGVVGKLGERSGDIVPALLGRGEAVLNWAHQKVVDPAMRAFYGFGLGDMFKRTNAEHGAGVKSIGYSSGGRARSRGRSSFPDAMGALPGLDALAWILKKRFGLSVVSGLRPGAITTSGNPSDHGWGGAIDVSNGITTPQMDAAHTWLLSSLGPALKQMLYRTMVGGNHFNHIHVALQEAYANNAAMLMSLLGKKLPKGMGGFGSLGKINLKGPSGPLKDIAQGASDKLQKAANAFMGKKTAKGSNIGMDGLKVQGPWVSVMRRLAKRSGWNFSDWWELVMRESSGDPTAVNPSSGAFGLGQFLGSTLDAYRKYGAGSKDPAKQIYAMWKYIKDRYGSPTAALSFHDANNWYARGGIAGGRMIEAHDGEMVLNPEQQNMLGGNSFLSSLFGFGRGTKTSFASGGNVGEKKDDKKKPSILGDLGNATTVWTRPARTLIEKILRESINTLQELPKSLYEYVIKNKGKILESTQKKWEEGMQKLSNQAGELAEEVSKRTARARTELTRKTYKIVAGKASLQDPRGISPILDSIAATRQEGKGLFRQRGMLKAGEKFGEKRVELATRQLSKLRKQLADAENKKDRQELESKIKEMEKARESARGIAKGFRTKIEEVNASIANNIAELYSSQQELFERRLEGTFPQHLQSMLNLRQQAAGMFGSFAQRSAGQLQIGQDRGAALQAQRRGLESLMGQAIRSKDIAQQEQLTEALEENRIAIMENTQELYELKIEASYPSHVKAMQDFRAQAAGFFYGYSTRTQQQLQVGRERAGSLLSQRSTLSALGQAAIAEGNWEQVERIEEALEENRIALLENSAEMHKLRMEATFSPHEQNMLSLQKQIAELSGENFSNNIVEEIAIEMKRASALAKQGAEYQAMLGEAIREGDIMWAEELEEAMLENRLAVLQNSKELAELNGTLGGPQEFTTTAWTLFRKAVFDGMGGLLPQFQVPALATGGMITKTGLFQLHAGEAVLRTDEVNAGNQINVEVNQAGQDLDPNWLAKRLSFEMKTKSF